MNNLKQCLKKIITVFTLVCVNLTELCPPKVPQILTCVLWFVFSVWRFELFKIYWPISEVSDERLRVTERQETCRDKTKMTVEIFMIKRWGVWPSDTVQKEDANKVEENKTLRFHHYNELANATEVLELQCWCKTEFFTKLWKERCQNCLRVCAHTSCSASSCTKTNHWNHPKYCLPWAVKG